MQKEDKERLVSTLTEKLRSSETLIVADYRGLTMPQIDALRSRLIEHGARFTVVKNTLTRRAAEAAGADALLALLEGPSAIAFVEADGDAVAVAKALADSARETKVLAVRGGIMQGRTITGAEVEELAKLPPLDVLRGQVIGAVIAPLTAIAGLVNAPLQNLYGLIDARIEQLEAATPEPGPAEPSQAPSESQAPRETGPSEASESESTTPEPGSTESTEVPESESQEESE